jgi:hypothetical protein
MDMKLGTWTISSLHRTGALKTVTRELGKYRLDLVGVQEVRWEKSGTERAQEYIFCYGEGNGEHQLGTGFFVLKFVIPRKPVGLIQMCLNETYSTVLIGKYQSEKFPIQNGLKQGDALTPLLFIFAVEFAIRRVQENYEGLKLNGTHKLLVYDDGFNIVGEYIHIIKKNTETLSGASKEVGLQVNPEKTEYMLLSRSQKIAKNIA